MKKNCLFFNENFPADKPSRLFKSIKKLQHTVDKLFIIDRTPESFPVQNAFFIIPPRKQLNYKSKGWLAFEFCLLIHNDMRDKFTRGNPQEFYYQIRSHSETERMRRVSSTSTV